MPISYFIAYDCLCAFQVTDDEVKLLDKQTVYQTQGLSCLGKSLHETVKLLLMNGKNKDADQIRKEFSIPERR